MPARTKNSLLLHNYNFTRSLNPPVKRHRVLLITQLNGQLKVSRVKQTIPLAYLTIKHHCDLSQIGDTSLCIVVEERRLSFHYQ